MLTKIKLEKLKSSWGEKADSLDSFAEVRVYDPLSKWCCYIYALNPEDEDEICCIIFHGYDFEVCKWSLKDVFRRFNSDGEYVEIDREYRPMLASEVLRKLNIGYL